MKHTDRQVKGNILDRLIHHFKVMLFRNRDIFTGEEVVEYGVVEERIEERLEALKKLRRFNNIYYVWDYSSDFKKLVFSYKYNRKRKLAKVIAGLIRKELEFILEKERIDYIVSTPINRKRENERGYNQVDEILKELKVSHVKIKRIKNTEKMHKLLDKKLREENIKGSFRIDGNIDFNNKRVLLVDDIITTGATLREIKKSILESIQKRTGNLGSRPEEKVGNAEIIVFCLAAAREIKKSKGEI